MAPNKGHVLLDPAVFNPDAIPPEVHAFNQKLMDIMKGAPKWYEVGAAEYREMRRRGETPLPPATLLDSAEKYSIPSRDSGREIPCRILKPTNGKKIHSVYLHIHGGGWVLQAEDSQDIALQELANRNGILMFSVGYRLAPEHAFPAGINDCYDAAEWLIDNAQDRFGASLAWVGGESAGGHLSMLVALHLVQHENQKYRDHGLRGLLLHFGAFDLNMTPGVVLFKKPEVLVLDADLMNHYCDAAMPGWTYEQKRDPSVSPLYADLEKLRGKLPPALFTCGTEDCLLDDTIFMSAKYQMAGADTEVLIVPGGPHGYIMYPVDTPGAQADVGMDAVEKFISTH